MAASAMTPKLLGRISNEKYQEEDKWKIDDIALGPANELLISGHSLEKHEAFISMHKEDSGKYDSRPEFSRILRQPQSGEQLALFLEGSSIIGLKTECALRLFTTESMGLLMTLWWKQSPTCVYFYRGNIYAASSSSTIVIVCNLDSEDKNDIVLSDMRNDCVLEIVVVMEKIYVCTKKAGRALVFSMTGSKEMEFKTASQTDAMAKSICIHERTELVFVSWNNFQIQLYSQKTSQCLRALDMTEKLHKIRVTTENILVTLSESKCIVAVYDVGAVIGESEKNILTLVNKKHRKILMSHGEENLECHSANSETPTTLSIPLKSASKQSNFDTDELHLKQLEEHENPRRKSDRDIHKLKESTKVLEDMIKETNSQQKKLKDKLEDEKGKVTREERSRVQLNEKIRDLEDKRTEIESQQDKLKDNLVAEKGKVTREERSRVQVETKLKMVEERNTKLEDEVRQLTERLLAEERISKEVQTSSLKLDEKIKDLEDKKTELESQQEKLKDNLVEEKQKVTRGEGSRVQVETKLKMVEERNTKLEDEVRQLTEKLLAEESISKEVQMSSLQLKEKIKELEGIRTELESQQNKLQGQLVQDKRKVFREERSRVQAETSRKSLEKTNALIENEKEDLTNRLATEKRKGREMRNSLSKAKTFIEKAKLMQREEREDLNKQLSTGKRNTYGQKAALEKNLITSLRQVRIAIDKHLGDFSEHGRKVNQLDSVQRKNNNEDLEISNRRTRKRRLTFPQKTRSLDFEEMRQEESGHTTDSTTDNEDTSGYYSASGIGWAGTIRPGSAAKIQHGKLGFTTDSATDFEEHRSYDFNDTSDRDTVEWDSDEEEFLDGQSKLEVRERVSVEGAHLKIAETGVSLFIPPGALSDEQTIHMKIIPQPCDAKSALKFECNSVVVVELLPNNCRFKCPVSLTLPHCLQLKEEYETNSIDVLISHHEEGLKPNWEILHDAKFYLWKENCTISLHSFCWVTYEIHDTIVEAKRIKLYTAGKGIRLNDRIAEVEVGFYPDLPGSGKILELNKDMHLSQRKPYVFLKTGEEPLLINLHKVVPKQWNNSQPDENPKIIPFESVSISEERSCPFVLERSEDDTEIPLCIFKVGQKGRNEVELTIRPDVLTA